MNRHLVGVYIFLVIGFYMTSTQEHNIELEGGTREPCEHICAAVCGSDCKTYWNDCERENAGVSKACDYACDSCGKCPNGPKDPCVPRYRVTRDLEQYLTEIGDPGCICPFVWDPVCGSDGETYGNDCFLSCEEGVFKKCDGECDKYGHCSSGK